MMKEKYVKPDFEILHFSSDCKNVSGKICPLTGEVYEELKIKENKDNKAECRKEGNPSKKAD